MEKLKIFLRFMIMIAFSPIIISIFWITNSGFGLIFPIILALESMIITTNCYLWLIDDKRTDFSIALILPSIFIDIFFAPFVFIGSWVLQNNDFKIWSETHFSIFNNYRDKPEINKVLKF